MGSESRLPGNGAVHKWHRHFCPRVDIAAHNGGRVVSGAASVLIHEWPASRRGDWCTCEVPTSLNSISEGYDRVRIEGLPAARRWHQTAHGGMVQYGSPTVLIGPFGPSEMLRLAIARIEVSRYGQTEAGKAKVKLLREMMAAGKITYSGRLGSATEGGYRADEDAILVNSYFDDDVDSTARILVHEGTHAQIEREHPSVGGLQSAEDERRCWEEESTFYQEQKNQGSYSASGEEWDLARDKDAYLELQYEKAQAKAAEEAARGGADHQGDGRK
jgi:uncharacterized Zn-binding protein involved in type VI secretion